MGLDLLDFYHGRDEPSDSETDSDRTASRQVGGSHPWRTAAMVGSYLFVGLAFIGLKWIIMDYDPGKLFPDTLSYVEVAQKNLTSSEFWAGTRPFTLPLLYKVLGVTPENFKQIAMMERVARAQFSFSTASWLLLGSAMGSYLGGQRLGLVGFGGMLTFGLNLHISQWDRLMISESVSTSFFVAALAWTLLGVSFSDRLGTGSVWGRVLYFLSLVLLVIGFSFARDSNLTLIAISAIGAALIASLHLRSGGWWPAWVLGVSGLLMLLCLFQLKSVQIGGRWEVPFYHVLRDRVLQDESARKFFTERGLPDGEPLEVLRTLDRHGFVDSLRHDGRYAHIKRWVHEQGRSTYFGYLLRQPLDALAAPVRHSGALVSPLSTEYRHQEAVTPMWLSWLTDIAFPRSTLVLGLVLGLCILSMTHAWNEIGIQVAWVIPFALIASSYPLMFVVWHGDSIEIERHAYQAAMQLRLGLLMLGLFLIDAELRILKAVRTREVERSTV